MSTSSERMAKKRSYDKAYQAGYAWKRYSEEVDVSAWANGVWQRHADRGLYDLQPGEEDLKVLLRKKKGAQK